MNFTRRTCLVVACLIAWGGAQPTAQPLPFHEAASVASAAVVPVPWAQPLAGGPIRALAIAPFNKLGDFATLQAHLELDLETVALWDRDHLGYDPLFPESRFPDAARDQVEARLMRALDRKQLDVIVIAQCDPAAFPEAVQRRIIDRVEGGTSLLFVGDPTRASGTLAAFLRDAGAPDDPRDFTRGVGPLGLTRGEAENLVSRRAAGEGRMVLLRFDLDPASNHALVPAPASPYDLTPEYESNAFSLVCRALLWLARRDAGEDIVEVVDISPKGPGDEEIPPGYPREFVEAVRQNAFNQPIRPFVLRLAEPARDTYDVLYRLRVPGAFAAPPVVDAGAVLPEGASQCALDILAAPGEYLLDIWLIKRRGIAAWHTAEITVSGWPRLRDIAIQRDGEKAVWVLPNDSLDLAINVEPGALLAAGDSAAVIARAVDSLDRLVATATAVVDANGGRVNLRLELADLIAPVIRVEVLALPGALAADVASPSHPARATYFFPVRLPDPPLQPEVILSTPGPFDYAAIRQLTTLRKALGAGIVHAPATVEALLATSAAGLNRIARVGTLDTGVGGTSSVRTPCLSSGDFWVRETEHLKAGALSAWAGGAATYSLGAGLALTTTDAQVCQSPACLARFRDALKASYGGIDALNAAWGSNFPAWSDIAPRPLDQCQQTGQWAPWLDFRLEMNGVLLDALRRARGTVLEIPGTGRTGFQTAAGPVTPVMGYDWAQITTAVDFIAAPPDPYIVRRLQSYQPARPLTGVVLGYRDLRDRGDWARWMAWDAIFRQTPAIWLDQPLNRGPQNLIGPDGALMPELATLRDALDNIQGGPGDLLLRATPRWTGIALADSTASRYLDQADPEPGRTAEEAETWLEHALNQMGFAARIQPIEGTLESINTIILSRIRVLSDIEVEALKRFHDRGSLILSDGRAGRFDIHGTPRASNPLPFLHPLHPDSPDDAFALWSNRPVWVSQAGEGASNREILAHLLARAGNEPSLPVELPEKQDGAVSLFQYAYGAATIVACLPDRDAPTTVRRTSVKLPDDTHAYSLLDAEASSVSRRIQWTIAPGIPTIHAILPYRVKNIAVEAPALAPAGSRLHLSVALDTGDVPPGKHGLMIQLADPTGRELRHYRQFIETDEGRAATFIPLAHNELPGRYTLTARDVLTRQSATAYIDVQ